MSEWDKRFENHPIHKTLGQFQQLLQNAENLAFSKQQSLDPLTRLRRVYDEVQRVFETTDPVLLPFNILDAINTNLSQKVVSEISKFNSNQNIGHLNNAANNCDPILQHIAFLATPKSPCDIDGLRDAISSFRKSAGQHLRYFEDDANKIKQELNQLKQAISSTTQEIQSQKGRLDQAIATFQEQFAKAEQERGTQFNNAIATEQSQFAEAEKKRTEGFQTQITEWKQEISSTTKEYENKLQELIRSSQHKLDSTERESTKKARAITEQLEGYKKEAQDLLHVIAATGMAGGYQEVADKEGKRAFWWHMLGILAMFGLVVFAFYAFIHTMGAAIEWTVFSARVFVAVSFALLATYAERQANRHSEREQRNRQLQLILASINPYLAEFPEEKQREVKEMIARTVFIATEEDSKGKDQVNSTTLIDLLRMVLENLSKK